MYLLLLVFGGLLGGGGVFLAVSGLSLRDGTFDPAILTPGILAASGGALLIGLGAGLRALHRIERALMSRPMPSALPIGESAKPHESTETQRESVRIPLPRVPDSQPGVVSSDIFGAKAPETASVADKKVPPVIALAAAHDANGESRTPAKNGNGAGYTRGLRLGARLRPPAAGDRQSEPALDGMWPKSPRSAPAAEPASVPIGQGSVAASNLPATNSETAASGLSVLKSGVVNGMPYTLYSDGSIEAQLPEGMLRFGSITELRNHIEQSA